MLIKQRSVAIILILHLMSCYCAYAMELKIKNERKEASLAQVPSLMELSLSALGKIFKQKTTVRSLPSMINAASYCKKLPVEQKIKLKDILLQSKLPHSYETIQATQISAITYSVCHNDIYVAWRDKINPNHCFVTHSRDSTKNVCLRLKNSINTISISPNHRVIATGSKADEALTLWDICAHYKQMKRLKDGPSGSVIALAFSNDSSRLAVAYNAEVAVFNVKYGSKDTPLDENCLLHVRTLNLIEDVDKEYLFKNNNLLFSPDGSHLAIYVQHRSVGNKKAPYQNTIKLFALDDGLEQNPLSFSQPSLIENFSFSPDEQYIAVQVDEISSKKIIFLDLKKIFKTEKVFLSLKSNETLRGFDSENNLCIEGHDRVYYLRKDSMCCSMVAELKKPFVEATQKYAIELSGSAYQPHVYRVLYAQNGGTTDKVQRDLMYVPHILGLKGLLTRIALKRAVEKKYITDVDQLKSLNYINDNAIGIKEYVRDLTEFGQKIINAFIIKNVIPYFDVAAGKNKDPFTHKALARMHILHVFDIKSKTKDLTLLRFGQQHKESRTVESLIDCLCSRECLFLAHYYPATKPIKKVLSSMKRIAKKGGSEALSSMDAQLNNLEEPLKTLVLYNLE